MMSGLRSQREYTMTWVSERSGRASSAMWLMDQTPAKIAAPVSESTTNRFRAENAMMRSIMAASVPMFRSCWGRRGSRPEAGERGLESRLGVHEEVRLRDDLVTRLEAVADFEVASDPGAGLDFAGLQAPAIVCDEDEGPRARRHHRAVRHGQDAAERALERDVGIHPGLESSVGVREFN